MYKRLQNLILIIIHVFFLYQEVYALAPWSAFQSPHIQKEILTNLQRTTSQKYPQVGKPQDVYHFLTRIENRNKAFTRDQIADALQRNKSFIDGSIVVLTKSMAVRESTWIGQKRTYTSTFVDDESISEIQIILDEEFKSIAQSNKERAIEKIKILFEKFKIERPGGISKAVPKRTVASKIFNFLTLPENINTAFTLSQLAKKLARAKRTIQSSYGLSFLHKAGLIELINIGGTKIAYGSALTDTEAIENLQNILDVECKTIKEINIERAIKRIKEMFTSLTRIKRKRERSFERAILDDGTEQSAGDINEKIVNWFYTGKGLTDGDYVITEVDLGGTKKFQRRKKYASIQFRISGKEGVKAKVVFLAEEDVNHGLVLNTYYFKDYEIGDFSKPIFSYKYFQKLKKVVKINCAGLDIIFAAYKIKDTVVSLSRPFKTKISISGIIAVSTEKIGIPKLDEMPLHAIRFSVRDKKMRDEKLAGKNVIVVLEDDGNHGQVINAYLEKDYNKDKKDNPVVTYKYCEGISEKAIPYDLGKMDVIKAYEGEELKVFGRCTETTIGETYDGFGVCNLEFHKDKKHGKYAVLRLPRELINKGAKGRTVIIRVEEDLNHGQVINIFYKSSFVRYKNPKPIVTYKFFPEKIRRGIKGVCRAVNLADLDMEKYYYYYGNTDIKPVELRSIEIPVFYWKNRFGNGFSAHWDKKLLKNKKIIFGLSNTAKKIFSSQKKGQKVSCRIKEVRDYGSYIELYKGKTVLAHYYYMKNIKKCVPVDFSKLAFMDYILGKKNIHGEDIAPRVYFHDTLVSKKRHRIRPSHRGRPRALITRMDVLSGKKPVFIPVKDETYGYIFHVHDQNDYKRNRKRKPDMVMVRNRYFNSLIPIEAVDIVRAREFMKEGLYGLAIKEFERILLSDPKRQEALSLLSQAQNLYVSMMDKLEKPKNIPKKEKFNFYLTVLADSIICGDATCKTKALDYFKREISMCGDKKLKKTADQLVEKLEFDEELPSRTVVSLAVLTILSELEDQYKTPAMAIKICTLLDYEGIYRDNLRQRGTQFFNSISDAFVYKLKEKVDIEPKDPLYGKILDDIRWYFKKISAYPFLKHLGELKIGFLVKCGDAEAKETMVTSNLLLNVSIAKNFRWSGLGFMDLIQQGNAALSDIAENERWEPQRGFKFSTYATIYIKGIIQSYTADYRNSIRVPRNVQVELRNFKRACQKHGIDPYNKRISIALIADTISWEKDKVKKLRDAMFHIRSLDIHYTGQDDERDSTLKARLAVSDVAHIRRERLDTIRHVIEMTIEGLREKWKTHAEKRIVVLKLYVLPKLFGIGKKRTLKKVGEVMDPPLTYQRVLQLSQDILSIMKKVFDSLNLEINDYVIPVSAAGSQTDALEIAFQNFKSVGSSK